jgi:hypothetical protein
VERERARIRDWRKRAEELRTVAGNMKDAEARLGMLNAAASYDSLADDAEGRAATGRGKRQQSTGRCSVDR